MASVTQREKPVEIIRYYGRHNVVCEKLTDGSKVYTVHAVSDDGPTVIFACVDEGSAKILASALQNGVCDISIRDTVPA